MELDMRKMRILQAIIDDYILTATPVGSRTISKNPDISLSSATIRNVMSDLEEMGYLEQPHTSAGRVPSEKAYRLYVNSIMRRAMLTDNEQRYIKSCYSSTINNIGELIRQTARVMSSMTRYISLVLPPSLSVVRLKHIQLVPVTEGKVLIVVVTDAGIVRDYLINVPMDLSAAQLERISSILTGRLRNRRIDSVAESEIPGLYSELESHRDFLNDAISAITAGNAAPQEVEMFGATNMLNHPEYSDTERARSFLSVIESRELLKRILMDATKVEFSVTIGAENPSDQMKDCSLVTATYRVGGSPIGSLGVLGPVRMDYARVLAVLSNIGESLSEILTNMFEEERH